MCLVTLPRWDSPNTLVRSCTISSELTYQLDVHLKLGFLVILYLLGRLVVGNICYFHVASLIKPAELGQNIRPSQGIPIHSFPCGKTADLRLRQEKEMQRTNMVSAKRAADLSTELLALRGGGGSARSRVLPSVSWVIG